MKNQWRLLVSFLIVLVIVIFAVLNVDAVPINFGFARVEWPLILILLITLVLGSLATVLVATVSSVKQKNAAKKAQAAADQKISDLEKANAELTRKLNNKGKQTVSNTETN